MGLDPVVLFFVFGLIAGLVKSELKLPPALYDTLSIIGLPLLAFPVLRLLRFPRIDSASISAHYGSVSAGTFAVVIAYLLARDIVFESYMPLFVAVLEVPAIIVGILLAKGVRRDTDWKALGHEVFLGKSIMLLLGGLIIGVLAGKEAIAPLEPLYTSMFKPVLGSLRTTGIRLVAFALIFPLVGAVIGALLGHAIGLSVGGMTVLATLAASGSYIAVPAAMRLALPEANPALSLTASLGITFPFNILVGIPLYLSLAEWLAA